MVKCEVEFNLSSQMVPPNASPGIDIVPQTLLLEDTIWLLSNQLPSAVIARVDTADVWAVDLCKVPHPSLRQTAVMYDDGWDHWSGIPSALRASKPLHRHEVDILFDCSATVPACLDRT